MKRSLIFTTAIVLCGLVGTVQADDCGPVESKYISLKSDYEACVRTVGGKNKAANPNCVSIKEAMSETAADYKACEFSVKLAKVSGATAKAQYNWKAEK